MSRPVVHARLVWYDSHRGAALVADDSRIHLLESRRLRVRSIRIPTAPSSTNDFGLDAPPAMRQPQPPEFEGSPVVDGPVPLCEVVDPPIAEPTVTPPTETMPPVPT
jgi:hypothetical protein